MQIIREQEAKQVSESVAQVIVNAIKEHESASQRPFILGLPTGSSPLGVYEALVRMHKSGMISFKNVVTFNMDEYLGLEPEHPQSYHRFMFENLFDKVDIPRGNINLLNGKAKNPQLTCEAYEEKIKSCGGIDLFLGGIGENGHIAFNESGGGLSSRTRVVTLSESTRKVNARFFDRPENVPKRALSIGISTLLDAKRIIIIALGEKKAQAIVKAIEGAVNHLCPASVLQFHPDVTFACDDAALSGLNKDTVGLLVRSD